MDFLKQIPILEFLCCELSTLFTQPSRLALEDSGQKLDVAPPCSTNDLSCQRPKCHCLSITGLENGQLRGFDILLRAKMNLWISGKFLGTTRILCQLCCDLLNPNPRSEFFHSPIDPHCILSQIQYVTI